MLFLVVISPMVQMSMYCFGYGRALEDLKVFVTNNDATNGICNSLVACAVVLLLVCS